MQDDQKLKFIQALRAVAVIAVVYYHWMGGDPFLERGYLGVDLFFVISGFIMVASTTKSDGSASYAARFIFRRFSRVWPAYAVLSVVVAIFNIVPQDGMSIVDRLYKSLLFIPLWSEQPTIPPGWSLPFEMAFYLMFAASIPFGRWRWGALAAIMSIGLVFIPLVVTGSFSFVVGPPIPIHGLWAYAALLSNPAMWSFLLGALVMLLMKQGIAISRTLCASVITVLIISGIFLIPEGHNAVTGLYFALGTLSLAFTNNKMPLNVPWLLVYLGDISYSIYLVHYPTKMVVNALFFRFVHHPNQLWVLFVIYVTLSIALAALSRKYLEVWLTEFLRRTIACVIGDDKSQQIVDVRN